MKMFFVERSNDCIEMALHHMCTLYLLMGSYMFNIWECGCIIAYLHDLSDIMGHLTKCMGQTTYDKITIPTFIMMMILWFWTRILVFPYCFYNIWAQSIKFGVYCSVTRPIYIYLLSMLWVMHIYWFSLFVRMVTKAIKKGDTEDRQNDT